MSQMPQDKSLRKAICRSGQVSAIGKDEETSKRWQSAIHNWDYQVEWCGGLSRTIWSASNFGPAGPKKAA